MKNLMPLLFVSLAIFFVSCDQDKPITPDLNMVADTDAWYTFNRAVDVDGGIVHLDAREGSGFVKLNDLIMGDGVVELDIKGMDLQGQSFVGLAFHGLNDSTYDAVYFRPFNFKNPERNSHSVQYIAHPEYPWYVLRENHPGKYENKLVNVPDPDGWFHVKIVIEGHMVSAYVDGSETPSLEVNQISHRHEGWMGFWVGHGSEGWFRNLTIVPGGESGH